jgi:hypothetical protein
MRVWSYSPEKLGFLIPQGIQLRLADEIVSRGLFNRSGGSLKARYFSDIFRHAALYQHGRLWMDSK